MGTSVVFEWRRNVSQLQGSSLPLTCCKQYAANIKALLTWNGLALSLELVVQKGGNPGNATELYHAHKLISPSTLVFA